MQEINCFVCNICGKTEYHNFGVRSDQREVIACNSCGMGVLKNIPEDTSVFYVGDYYSANSEKDGYSNYDYTASHSLLWVKYAIEFFIDSGNILDIGAANGFLLSQLSSSYHKYGIEVNSEACVKARANDVKIISSDIYNVNPNYDSFFHIITSIATYEHVVDFRKAVEDSLRLLKPDGVLIFEVPVISNNLDSSIWYETSLEHIYYPTVSGLTELFRILGVNLVGFESSVNGFGTTYIGIVTRSLRKNQLARKFIDIITETDLSILSEEERSINVAFNIVHSFFPTSDGILALPLLIQRGINNNVMSRLTQLWHNDFVKAYRLQTEIEQKEKIIADILNIIRQNEMVIRNLRKNVSNNERIERYASRVDTALTDFSAHLKERVDLNNPDLKEIFELASAPSKLYSYDKYEASDRMIEINQKMLPLLAGFQETSSRLQELTNRLNHAEQYASRVDTALTDFSAHLKERVDLNNPDLKEIFELASAPSKLYSYDKYEASDRMIEINQKMLPLLAGFQETSSRLQELTNRLNHAERHLSEVISSTSWRATEGLRGVLSRNPRVSRLTRRTIKILGWIHNGTFFQHLKLYLAHRNRKAMPVEENPSLDCTKTELDVAEAHVSEPEAVSRGIHFTPKLSVVLRLSPEAMKGAVSNLLDIVPKDWELIVVGTAERWELSHPLLRYIDASSLQNEGFAFDEIIGKTFGKFVVFVGASGPEEARPLNYLDYGWGNEIHDEAARLTHLIDQAQGANKVMCIQRLWHRPE